MRKSKLFCTLAAAVVMILTVFVFAACEIDDGPPPVSVTDVTINYHGVKPVLMQVGGAPITLTATVTPDDATDGAIGWSASPAGILTLVPQADGVSVVVTPAAEGNATVTATAQDGSGKNDTLAFVVSAPPPAATNFTVDDQLNLAAVDARWSFVNNHFPPNTVAPGSSLTFRITRPGQAANTLGDARVSYRIGDGEPVVLVPVREGGVQGGAPTFVFTIPASAITGNVTLFNFHSVTSGGAPGGGGGPP